MKLGSLFDGSGTCPLAATLCGIEPVWASEIEPYPIKVTKKNFPQMKHLGDVTQIKGDEIEPVDIITFGSPCQDLSVAGKRAGIHDGERSSLFFEAIRIIKEMREKTHGRYPTVAVWENVPGAFSSNRGRDFLAVLQAFVEISGGCNVPEPAIKQGKLQWGKDGCIMGDGFSLAWRMLDAQYWGVPQRRKRIYLVADFAGGRAPEILFKREGLSWDSAESGAPGQGTADDAAGSAGGSRDVKCLNPWDCQSKRIYQPGGVYPTLPAMDCGGANNQAVLYALDSMSSNSMKSSNPHSGFHAETIAKTLQAGGVDPTCNQGRNVIVEPMYVPQSNGIDRAETAGCNGNDWRENVCYTLNTIDRPAICFKPGQGAKARTMGESEKTTPTLASEAGGNSVPGVCYPNVCHTLTAHNAGNVESARTPNRVCYPINEQIATRWNVLGERTGLGIGEEGDPAFTLQAAHPHIVCYDAHRIKDYTTVCVMAHGQSNAEVTENISPVLNCNHEQPIAAYGVDCRNAALDEKKTHTLQAKANGGQSLNCTPSVLTAGKPPRKYIIRRLTPLECCRLQGFPDWWEEEVEGSDTARYKMWGNGMALPCVLYVMQGIADAMGKEREA